MRIVIAACLLLFGRTLYAQPIEKGVVDGTTHSFSNSGAFLLAGDWEFYWDQLLEPGDFPADNSTHIHVPSSWHNQEKFPLLGKATYRVVVKLPAPSAGLVLYFPVINSAAKVWINGSLLKETGKVSPLPDEYRARLYVTLVPVPDGAKQLEIVVQVENYTYFTAGITGTPRIDFAARIFEQKNRDNGIENFFAGSLIAMFVYQLILYFLYHRGKPYLWLSLICLGVALRALIIHGGSFLLPNLFPEVSWEFWKKIEFGMVYAIGAFFPLYVYTLFIDQAPRKPIWIFVAVAALLCAAVIVTPQYVYGQLLDVSHLMLLLAFIYAVYSITKAWRAGNEDARTILFGVLASFPFILIEILKNSRFSPFTVRFMYLVELGVLVFLLFQVYLLANHYAKSYRNLETLNVDLEKKVAERTGELTKANVVRDRLLSVMSHDIKSPLNSLRGILEMYNRGVITQEEFSHFAKQIEGDLGKTNLLVENMLHWTANQLKGVQVKTVKFDLTKLIEENIHLFERVSFNKNIAVRHNAPEKLIVNADRNILNMVLRNLLSNALKFSHEGGLIQIVVKITSDSLLLQVIDEGVGMSEETISSLLDPKSTISQDGTVEEKGTGLGLALCRDYLKQAGGLLTIESTLKKGSTFSVVLPL